MAAPIAPEPGEPKPAEPKAPLPAAAPKVASKGSRASVSSLLSSVQASEAEKRSRHLRFFLALVEIAAVVAVHLLLLAVSRLPGPDKLSTEEIKPGGQTRYVWLQVRPRCWDQPNWDTLFRQAQEAVPTAKVSFVGTGDARHLRLDGVMDNDATQHVMDWATQHPNACLNPAKGKEDYSLEVKARWSPTTQADLERAATKLAPAHAAVKRLQWQPDPLLFLQSDDFPERSLVKDEVTKALTAGGLRDFVVEPATEQTIDGQAKAAWRQLAVIPALKAQRGALVVQSAVFLILAALWMLVLRGRFATAPVRETLPWPETLTRVAAGLIAAVAVGMVVAKKIGFELGPLQALVREPDPLSKAAGMVAYGMALPALQTIVVLGYAERRLAEVTESTNAIVVMAVLYPLGLWMAPAVPLWSPQFFLMVPVAAIAGYLLLSTARLGAALTVTLAVQFIVAFMAFG